MNADTAKLLAQAQEEIERLRDENGRLHLALALLRKPMRKRPGRPIKSVFDREMQMKLVDILKDQRRRRYGIEMTDKEALAVWLEAEYEAAGKKYRAHGVKEQQELKTRQNRLSAFRKKNLTDPNN